jgi:hypothetical protein
MTFWNSGAFVGSGDFAMPKPGGKCVFCGRGALTKGHVWPNWISKILPVTASHHDLMVGKFETFTTMLPGPEYSVKQRQGSARQRKPRNTCKCCNGGWMSLIETAAIKPMTPLIHGIDIPLRIDDQRALAALLCLINMRLEFLGDFRAIPASDRDAIRNTGLPPPGWCIWLAKFTGEKGEELVSRYCAMMSGVLTPPKDVGPELCNTQATTLVIGKLCAHLFRSSFVPFIEYDGARLTKIWPLTGYDIQSRFMPTISDQAVVSLAESLARAASESRSE